MRILVFALSFLVLTEAQALDLTIPLPLEAHTTVERLNVDYDCAGESFAVDYINAGPVSLAVFSYDNAPVVSALVLSASGARYAGGRFIWWTKGNHASLYDLMKGEDAPPALECSERN